jgi:hypothetical protein
LVLIGAGPIPYITVKTKILQLIEPSNAETDWSISPVLKEDP